MRIFLSIINNLRHGKTNEQGHSGKSHRVYCGWSCAQKHHPCTHTRNSWKILSHRPSPERTSRESHQVRVRVFVCVRMCNARAHTCTHLTVIHTWEFRVQFQSDSQSETWPVCRRPSSGGATATRAAQEHRTRSKAPDAPEPTHSSSTKRPDCCGLKEYMCKNAGPRANARDLAVFGLLMLLRVRRCAHARALALEAAQECTRRTMGRDLTKSSRQGR